MVNRAGLFTNRAHLQHHRWEDVGIGHGGGEAGTRGYFLLNTFCGTLVEVVTGSAAHRVQCFNEWYACGKHGGKCASPACDARLLDQRAEDGQFEHGAIHELLYPFIAFPGLHEEVEAPAQNAKNQPPVLDKIVADAHDEQGGCRQISAKRCEDFLEGRNHKNHDDGHHDQRHDHHGCGVHQGRLDFGFDVLRLLHISGKTI